MSDWSLPDEVFAFLEPRVRDMWVLELGSGAGSARLAGMCDHLVSVEHDLAYVEKYEGDRCIHAPIVDGWYDRNALESVPWDSIDCVVVDGPPGAIGRGGLLRHLDLFPDVPFLFDDTHRGPERELAISYWKLRGKNAISLHALKNGRGFSTVGWEF